MSDYPSESWLDAHLRDTPLPETLLERLRGIARAEEQPRHVSDEAMDRLLTDIPLPPDFVARMRAFVREDRAARLARVAALDQRVCDVPLPPTLLAGVRAAVAEESLDELVRTLPTPAAVAARARVVPQMRLRWPLVLRGAVAAALFLMVGVSYLASVIAVTAIGRPATRPVPQAYAVRWGPLEFEAPPADDAVILATASDWAVAPGDPAGDRERDLALADLEATYPRGPAGELALAFESGFRPFQNAVLAQWKPLGARFSDDNAPNLETVPPPASLGAEPPLVRGFDRVFLYNRGVFPRVNPGADPVLASWSTPLLTSTTSFDRTERLAAERRLPRPRDVRVEDFLAAVDYAFPRPHPGPGEVRIRTAAGPSVFGNVYLGMRPQLLQVAAQAGPIGSRKTPVTHLTVALDISASMNGGGRIQMVQRALADLLDHLDARDRLSLVAFNQDVAYVVEDAARDDRQKLIETINGLRPFGGVNVETGLREAVTLSLAGKAGRGAARRVVLITDGYVGLPASEARQVERVLAQAAEQGLQLDVVDLSQQEAIPEYLERFASAGRGRVHRGDSAEQIRWALVENLYGQSATVIDDASLRLKFNPQAVAAYRLLGHEPGLAGTASPGEAGGQLRSRQAATVLYEVWLAPNEDDDIAVAELTGTDARTGRLQRQEQRISRLQFSPSFAEAPLSLQAATIVAQTAEVLRESAFIPAGKRDFGNILQLAGRVNPQLAEQESFRRFVALLRQLNELQ